MKIIPVRGFDPAGEPEIRLTADGTLRLLFNFMPPSDVRDDEEELFQHFEEHLSNAAGVPVIQEDREVFLVQAPQEDTVGRLVGFLERCRAARSSRAAKPSVRGTLHAGLAALLEPHGFKLRMSEQAFVRAITGGKQKLFVAWVDRRPQYEFTLGIGVRLDAVEEIVNRFADLAPKYHRDSMTTTTQLEYFGLKPERGRGVWFSLSHPDEVGVVLRELQPVFRDRILPFLERNRDVAALDQGLHAQEKQNAQDPPARQRLWQRWFAPRSTHAAQEDPAEAAWQRWEAERRAFDGTNNPVRRMKGLVVAHLAGNPRYEEWLARYRAELDAFPETDLQRFEALALYLREAPPKSPIRDPKSNDAS